MSGCQTHVFRLIAESPLPLSTHNIMQQSPYSEDSIRKSITNLRRKNLIESTNYRYFLTAAGKQLREADPTLASLDGTIGSYVRPGKPVVTRKEFLSTLIQEAEKTEFGRNILSHVEGTYLNEAAMIAFAPYVALYAIHVGLITQSRNYNFPLFGATLNKSLTWDQEKELNKKLTEQYDKLSDILNHMANLIKGETSSSNGN